MTKAVRSQAKGAQKKKVETDKEIKGSAILLQKDESKVEHFPMLDVVFDKFVHSISLDLRNFFSDEHG